MIPNSEGRKDVMRFARLGVMAMACAALAACSVFEGDKINATALKKLIRTAVAFNQAKLKKKAPAGNGANARKSKKA